MKKNEKKEFHPKTYKYRDKKTNSIDYNSSTKINNNICQKLCDKIEQNNGNNINTILSKEKLYQNKNISINSKKNSHINKKNRINNIKNKRNNISLIVDYNKKMNYATISKDDILKNKTNKLFLSAYDNSKIPKNLKYKKINELSKSKKKNRSCKHLSNINLNLYNNKYLNKNRQKNNSISDNENNLSSNQNKDFLDIKGKIGKKLNPEEFGEILINPINIKLNNGIKKNKKIFSDKRFYINDLLDNFNLNKNIGNKEYIYSENNYKNKQYNDDYDKDLEYLNINIPYTIKVNLTKKNKNNSMNYQNTNTESIFCLNKSINKNEINNILLLIDNNIKLEIKKSNIKSINNKKKYIFDNDDIIIFVKNKFNEKNTKYLSELQSKNYITNIFGNTYNNVKKKKNNYTGFTLNKKINGKNDFEIELNNCNLESLNKILKNEKFEINGEHMIFTPSNYINLLREGNKNTKWENNKIKEDNKNINMNISKLKEENFFLKMKYGKFKHDYDYLLEDIKMANYKKKEYLEEINKKDNIIKKYEKIINENQNEIRKLENKMSSYKTKTNIFSFKNEIQINLINKKRDNIINNSMHNNKVILRNIPQFLKIENINSISYDKLNIIKNINNIAENINIIGKEVKEKNIDTIKVVEIENFTYNSSNNNLNKKLWIYDKNIMIENVLNLNISNRFNTIINKKENNISLNKISLNDKIRNINKLIKQEKIYNINYGRIKHNTSKRNKIKN